MCPCFCASLLPCLIYSLFLDDKVDDKDDDEYKADKES